MKQLTLITQALLLVFALPLVASAQEECDPYFEICDDYCFEYPEDPLCYDPDDPFLTDPNQGEEDDFCLLYPEYCDEGEEFDYGDYDDTEEFGDEFDVDSCNAEVDSLLDLIEYLLGDSGDLDGDGTIDPPVYDGQHSLPGAGTIADLTQAAKNRQIKLGVAKGSISSSKNNATELKSKLKQSEQKAKKFQRKFKRLKRKSRGR